ncbi:hypothetical protein [Streptomyces sp. NPDC048410]|uniref:hypothetical protein n=1 Tax=Streptomyces sp. NPDC048410 TaxID=3365545 RepID=UPI0037171BF1
MLTSICDHAAMDASAEARLRNLLVATSNQALEVATSAAVLADPLDGPLYGLHYMSEMKRRFDTLECLVVATLRQSGVSWDVIASRLGVTRQSLHRRLSKRVDDEVEFSQKYPDMNEEGIFRNLSMLIAALSSLRHGLPDRLDEGVLTAAQRRRQPAWWWSEDDA